MFTFVKAYLMVVSTCHTMECV